MQTTTVHRNHTTLPGLFSGTAMIVLLLVSVAAAWPYFGKLHHLNNLILAPAIIYTAYVTSRPESTPYPYLKSLGAGVVVSIKASLLFCIFLLLYLAFLNKPYMSVIREIVPLGNYMNPLVVALVFFTEQVSAGLVITLIALQMFKGR